MLKKVVIAGLAVAVGVAVLAWLSPKLISTIRYEAGQAVESAEDAVPLETEIGRLRGEVKRLESDESRYYDQVAKQAVEVDKLRTGVNETTAGMDKQWKNIEAMRKDLGDDVKTSFQYRSGTYSREEVTKQLKLDFESYQKCEQELAAQKNLLSAEEKSLAASNEQLHSLKGQRENMKAELAQLEADLKLVRMKEAQTDIQVDDTEYSRAKADIAKVREKIDTRKKALELKGEPANGPIDATAGPAQPDEEDLFKQIDERNGKKADGKVVVQDNSK
jgi:chromosome segregation ATPase